MLFSRNPITGIMESYEDDGVYSGNVLTMANSIKKDIANDGGPGSGNFGHKGRPGKVGGSGEGKGSGKGTIEIGEGKSSGKYDSHYERLEEALHGLSLFGPTSRPRALIFRAMRDLTPDNRPVGKKDIESVIADISIANAILDGIDGNKDRKKLLKGVSDDLVHELEEMSRAEVNAVEKPPVNSGEIKTQPVKYASAPKEVRSLENFSEFSKKKNSEYLKIRGVDEETVKKATEVMKDVFENGRFGMRVPCEFVDEVFDEGFKSQHETEHSRGYYNKEERRDVAHELFGLDKTKLDDRDYEKYGLLMSDDVGNGAGGQGYGDCSFTFKKDRLAGRVTYTINDSFCSYTEMAAGSVNIGETTFGGIDSISEIERMVNIPEESRKNIGKFLAQFYDVAYIELQYHGKMTLDDVESVGFRTKSELEETMTPEMMRTAKEKGIRVCYWDAYNGVTVYV